MFLLGMTMEVLIRFPIEVGNDNGGVVDDGGLWVINFD